jgi:hypothetical protein
MSTSDDRPAPRVLPPEAERLTRQLLAIFRDPHSYIGKVIPADIAEQLGVDEMGQPLPKR